MRLLLIDNYDSFTYNLVQRIGELDASIDMRVVRNDKIDGDGAEALAPSHLLLSPGPCTPSMRIPSMSPVFEGPVTQTMFVDSPKPAIASGTVRTRVASSSTATCTQGARAARRSTVSSSLRIRTRTRR